MSENQASKSRRFSAQAGIAVRLILIGVLLLAGLGYGLYALLARDPIAACVEDGSGDPPDAARFAVALSDCVQAAVAAAETPAEASREVYDFLTAMEAVDAFGPLLISNWAQVPDALKSNAMTGTMSRIMPYLREPIRAEVHRTGTDQTGEYVLVSYRARSNQGTALKLYLVPGPYGFAIPAAQFAPVN